MKEKKSTAHVRKMARKVLKDYFNDNANTLPVPIEEIVKKYNIEVLYLDTLEPNHKAIKHILPEDNRVLFGINKNHHIHSQRFSIGHELGHHILGHPTESICTDEEIKLYNQEADEFSSEILMPLSEIKSALTKKKSVAEIVKIFCVSKEALVIKISSCNLLKYM
ncbi:MAG: ImmA/IrrE family metallo-endopeptidase [Chlorobium sp.]